MSVIQIFGLSYEPSMRWPPSQCGMFQCTDSVIYSCYCATICRQISSEQVMGCKCWEGFHMIPTACTLRRSLSGRLEHSAVMSADSLSLVCVDSLPYCEVHVLSHCCISAAGGGLGGEQQLHSCKGLQIGQQPKLRCLNHTALIDRGARCCRLCGVF